MRNFYNNQMETMKEKKIYREMFDGEISATLELSRGGKIKIFSTFFINQLWSKT